MACRARRVQMPGAQPPSRSSNAAPPPRGGAMPRERDEDVSSLSEPNVITADPDRSGMLPPPPERFPQRAAPAAPPKPMKRTAAAPPKQAPLPKPKPAANTDAPPAPAPQAPPQSAQPFCCARRRNTELPSAIQMKAPRGLPGRSTLRRTAEVEVRLPVGSRLGLDHLRLGIAVADGDLAGLLRLGNLAHEFDVQETVLEVAPFTWT